MEKHEHQHGSGFGNGFLLGIIVGAALVFFLFTKRGKQLLKVISEEGLAEVEEFKELLDLDDEEEYYEDMPSESPTKMFIRGEKEVAEKVSKGAKRFFRGVPRKKVN